MSIDASPETTSGVSPVIAIVCVTPFASRMATPPVCTFVQSSGVAPVALLVEIWSELTTNVRPGTPVSEPELRSALRPSHERWSVVSVGVSDAIASPPPLIWKPTSPKPTKSDVAVIASVVSDALVSPATPPIGFAVVPVMVCVVSANPTVPLISDANDIVAVPVM